MIINAKKIFFGLLSVVLLMTSVPASAIDTSSVQAIPMQDAGRYKPYDSFARETLLLLYGKRKYNKRPAHEIVFTWFLLPEAWAKKEIIQLKQIQLKESLKLAKEESYFSPHELMTNDRLPLLFQELDAKQQAKEKLDPYYQSIQRLSSQLSLFRAVTSGMVFTFVPPKEGTKWLSVGDADFPKALIPKFQTMTSKFIHALGMGLQEVGAEKEAKIEAELKQAVEEFTVAARAQNPELYPSLQDISVEVFYNRLDPFQWSWILYLIAAIFLGVAWYTGGKRTNQAAWVFVVVGFLMHILGFALRVYIAGRPPVSNMYETVIWVSFGGMLFAMIIEAVYRQKFVLFCGAIGSVFCLVLASMAPGILDASIQPLEPVLVSNFWLLVHVMTITISYSAFLLAFVLGDIGLGMAIINEGKFRKQISNISNAIYRSMQIGVVLLAAGTILGGIWADYSWGRFWGWDPKETWALIALLGYLAVLHGRLSGWLRDFGVCASAVVAFSLVIMAWYGVNFVLGAGLHSYGFGGGGVQYVSGFVGIHVVYVIYAIVARQKNKGKSISAQ